MAATEASPVLRRGPAAGSNVYLTFDDGPDERWTPRMLDILAKHAACATFFVLGREVRPRGNLLRRIRDSGHAIGSHGFSHRHPWAMSTAQARAEVRNGSDAISAATGESPELFRPPFGRLRPAMCKEAEATGLRIVLWSLSAIDWGVLAGFDGIERRLRATRSGDIVLMHDAPNLHNRPDVLVDVLPAYLSQLRMRSLVPSLLSR